MKPTDHNKSFENQNPSSQVLDVAQFFSEITENYLQLQESILQLENKIADSSPEQILDECRKIAAKRAELVVFDQKMLDIIKLVGKEIAREPIVHDYRVAFAAANMACNNLHQRLKSLRCSLEEETSS